MTEDTKPLPVFTKYNNTEIALLHKDEKRMVKQEKKECYDMTRTII